MHCHDSMIYFFARREETKTVFANVMHSIDRNISKFNMIEISFLDRKQKKKK